MKTINSMYKTLAVLSFGLLFIQCSDNDDMQQKSIPVFSESDLSVIHDDSQKSWRITGIINDYYDPTYDLEITLDCVTDDIYTFTSGKNEVTIDYGDQLCFEDNIDGIFTADNEFFESNIMMLDATNGPTIYLHFARGYMNENGTAASTTFTYYALAELTANRMVFYRLDAAYVGSYKDALIFEAVDIE